MVALRGRGVLGRVTQIRLSCAQIVMSPSGPHPVRITTLLLPLLGLTLLAFVLRETDVAQLRTHIEAVGWTTFGEICLLFLVYFAADVINWQAALPQVPRTLRWFSRLWLVRMIGDAYNNVTPTAALGGEPIKAWLMKRRYGVAWRDTGAGIVIARTSTMFALIVFVAIGVALVWHRPDLDSGQQGLALATLMIVVAGTGAIFLVQYFKFSTRMARALGATRWGARLVRAIATVEDIDRQLTGYYRQHRYALVVSIAAAWLAWVLGALEAWVILHALGVQLSFADVWIMEAFVQSVRAASFFIPAALGTQEAAMLVMINWLSGAQSVGIATALVRRARELLWIVASLLLGAACAATPHQVAQFELDE